MAPRREGSFRVAFVFTGEGRASACVYSSETAAWGRLITADARCGDVENKPSAMVGDALYWVLDDGDILELHLGKESLAVVEPPPGVLALYEGNIQLMDAADGALGLAGMDVFSLQLWARQAGRDGGSVASCWVLRKTISLDAFAPQPHAGMRVIPVPPVELLAVDEDGSTAFIWTMDGIFMVHLEDEMLKKVSANVLVNSVYPYSSFYVADMDIGNGCHQYQVDSLLFTSLKYLIVFLAIHAFKRMYIKQ
uniref:F-box protein AT5G49610-like beta-propeller domain-containing protein n=1 Tax=Oryza brachyantha TaxID=4533 RepID=J3N0W3_ORYBR